KTFYNLKTRSVITTPAAKRLIASPCARGCREAAKRVGAPPPREAAYCSPTHVGLNKTCT
ncbi:MAG: hypothetical protein KAW12_09160, partial [Candidatus Aminicenantes bacterium]|nr:hypothetical protein [Candidatus Aminicenantes bacterium]